MQENWLLIEDPASDGQTNMKKDEELFHSIKLDSPPILRLYSWSPPAISLGYFQTIDQLPEELKHLTKYDVVKRITGGGAILHTPEELTLSFFYDGNSDKIKNDITGLYDFFIDVVKETLSTFEIETTKAQEIKLPRTQKEFFCFNRREKFDLVHNNTKIFGVAQRRIKNKVMLHGSIIIKKDESINEQDFLFSPIDKKELKKRLIKQIEKKASIKFTK